MTATSARHQAFVDELSRNGCFRTAALEAAFRAVDRRRFLSETEAPAAYEDAVIVTKTVDGIPTSASSQPSFTAVMLDQLAVQRGDRVLEIGTGTGYTAALLARLVGPEGRVTTVEIDGAVAEVARARLADADYANVETVLGDGGFGYAEAAPYDRIIVTVGARDIPPALREQLRPGGRLVVPLSIRGAQRCIAFDLAADHLASVSVADCDFSTQFAGSFAAPAARRQIAPGVYLWLDEQRPLDDAGIAAALDAAGHELQTMVSATVEEVFSGLYLWLALREERFCQLGTTAAAAPVLPWLLRLPGKLRMTAGLLDAPSISVLTASPGGAGAVRLDSAEPLNIGIRSYGPDGVLGRCLADQVIAWDHARRPTTHGLRVRAYASADRCEAAWDEIVVRRPWLTLLLSWSATAPPRPNATGS